MAESSLSTNDAACEPPLKSLAMVREEHGALLSRRTFMEDDATHQAEFLSEVELFSQRVQATGALLESHEEREAAQAVVSFWNNYLYRAGRDSSVVTLAEFDPNVVSVQCELSEHDYPYPKPNEHWIELSESRSGELIQRGLEILARDTPRLLALIGPRNSGRSALVQFGLLPALRDGALPGSSQWHYYTTSTLGSASLLDLARHFVPSNEDADLWCQRQVDELKQDPTHLHRLVKAHSDQPAVLVLEDFEQLLKRYDEEDSRTLVDNLLTLCRSSDPHVAVILVIHSDFRSEYDQLVQSHQLPNDSYLLIKPIDSEQLQISIEKPADRVGLRFREGLVEQLVIDVLGDPAAVPLLLITLRQLWKRRSQNWITWDAYYGAGGAHILERCLAEFYRQNHSESDRGVFKRILLRLVRPSLGAEVLCPWVSSDSLYDVGGSPETVDRILVALLDIGFLKSDDRMPDQPQRVAVTHVGLVPHFQRLMEWLEVERMDKRQRLRLTAAAQQWKERGRDEGALWGSPSLVAEAWQLRDPPLTSLETEFLQASEAWLQREENAKKRRAKIRERVYAAAVIAAILIVALTVGVLSLAIKQRNVADEQRALKTEEIGLSSLRDGDPVQAMAQFIEARNISRNNEYRDALHMRNSVLYRQLPELEFVPQSPNRGNIKFASFSPDGSFLATLEEQEKDKKKQFQLILWDSRSGQISTTVDIAEKRKIDKFTDMRFSPDGSLLFVTFAEMHEQSGDENNKQKTKDEQFSSMVYEVNKSPTRLVKTSLLEDVRSVALGPSKPVEDESSAPANENFAFLLTVAEDRKSLAFRTTADAAKPPMNELKPADTREIVQAALDSDGRRWFAVSRLINVSQAARSLHLGSIDDETWPQPEPAISNVSKALFSPDGQMLLTIEPEVGEEFGPVRIRSLTNGGFGDLFEATAAGARDVVFSPNFMTDGLLAATMESTVLLWKVGLDEKNSRFVHRFWAQLPHAAVRSIRFSSDGRYVVTGSRDQSARVWNVEAEGKPFLRSPTYHGGTVDRVEFGNDGQQLLVKGGATASVWRMKMPARLDEISARCVAISPDGQLLAIGDQTGRIAVWNREQLEHASPKPEREYTGSLADQLLFDPQNRFLVAVVKGSPGVKREVVAWDRTNEHQAPMNFENPPPGDVSFVAFNDAGDQLLILDTTLKEAATDEKIEAISVWQRYGETWRANGKKRFEVSNTNEQQLDATRHNNAVLWAAFDPTSRFIATGSKDDSVRIWSNADEVPDGRYVGMIRKENASEKAFQKEWPKGHPADVTCLAFGHGGAGDLLLTASANGIAKLWDFRGDQSADVNLRQIVEHRGGGITRVAFSPDGNRFVTVGTDRKVRLWNVEDGGLLGVFPHNGTVALPAFRVDDATLLTADYLSQPPRVAFHDWNLTIEDGESLRNYTELVAARELDPDASRWDRSELQKRRRAWLTITRMQETSPVFLNAH